MNGGSFPENDQFGPAFWGPECLGNSTSSGRRAAHPMDGREDGLLRKPRCSHDLSEGSAGGCEDVVSEGHTPKGKNVFTDVKRRILSKGKENVYHWRMERSPKPLQFAHHRRDRGRMDRSTAWRDKKGDRNSLTKAAFL